jgi:phenylacetate-CoA ligase
LAALRSAFVTRVIDPLGWRIKRTDVGGRLREFRARQWDEVPVWKARQAELLGRLLTHSVTRVPYYKERMGGLTRKSIEADPFAALAEFPVLERSELIEHFDELICEMGRGSHLKASGGSTGTPVRVVHDRVYDAAAFATTQLSLDWEGVARGDRRVALWGARRDLGGRFDYVRRLNYFLRDITVLDAFRMGEEEMTCYVHIINRRPPVCIEGYTEAIFALAEFARREGLRIASPRVVGTGAGTLLPAMRETISRVFGAPVFDRYGTREQGLYATECDRHRGLHVMGETTVLELIDGNGREIAEGQAGEAVTTNLWNYTMPLIRYRVGDHVVKGPERCECGRPYPLLARVVGRSAAAFPRPDGGLVLPDFWIRLFAVEFNTGDIEKYQFVQEAIDRIEVRVVVRPGRSAPDERTRRAVTARIDDAMGTPCDVRFEVVDDIPPTASGKHLYSVSRIS